MPAGCGLVDPSATTSLGGNVAGDRGRLLVVFINNTPQRVAATFGTYDTTDPSFAPDFRQFTPAADGSSQIEASLDAGATSDVFSLSCARVFSIGGPNLIELIRRNRADANADATALAPGVDFFDPEALPSPDAGTVATKPFPAAPPTAAQARPASVGSALPFEARLGVDFPCESLIIIRFEISNVGLSRFAIDFELIPSESTR